MASNFSQMLALKSNLHSPPPPPPRPNPQIVVFPTALYIKSPDWQEMSLWQPPMQSWSLPSSQAVHPVSSLFPPMTPDGCSPLPALPRENHFISGSHTEEDTCQTPHGFCPCTVEYPTTVAVGHGYSKNLGTHQGKQRQSHKIIYPGCFWTIQVVRK